MSYPSRLQHFCMAFFKTGMHVYGCQPNSLFYSVEKEIDVPNMVPMFYLKTNAAESLCAEILKKLMSLNIILFYCFFGTEFDQNMTFGYMFS